jgi:putative membrane protein
MKKSIAISAAVLAAAFSFAPLAGAEQGDNPQQPAQVQNGQQRAEQAGRDAEHREGDRREEAGDIKMNADQHFIKEAAADNQFEIQLSEMVGREAQDPQVKELAEHLARDHREAQQQLQQIAQGMNMQLPTQLEQWQQDKLQAMQQKHGKHLEMHYTFGQVGGHTTDLLNYRYEAEHGENAQVKEYAEKCIPILERHLAMAQQAAEQWVPQARTAGEHIHGAKDAAEGAVKHEEERGTNNQGINR